MDNDKLYPPGDVYIMVSLEVVFIVVTVELIVGISRCVCNDRWQ